MPEVSLFASAVRPKLWKSLFDSLKGTSVSYEIVFAGYKYPLFDICEQLNFILTDNIKPAQCYEIARRHCTGECVMWVADDAEYPNDVVGKAYKYWKSQNNEKLILSLQTKETGYKNINGTLFDMNIHRFFGGDSGSPLMAPLGMMSRKFLDELGGIDKRFICGQYENLIVMMAYAQGAKVEIFGGEDCYVDIDHLKKSIECGECTNDDDFRQRPFASGYKEDRRILESICCKVNKEKYESIMKTGRRQVLASEIYDIEFNGDFQPYPKGISLTESEEPKGRWV